MDALYVVLADAVFGFHLAFIVAIGPSTALFVLGAYRARPALAGLHCGGVLAMAIGQGVSRECPLVPLERALRSAAGDSLWYRGSFTSFIIERATGWQMPIEAVTALSLLIMALTAAGLALPRWHPPVRRARART